MNKTENKSVYKGSDFQKRSCWFLCIVLVSARCAFAQPGENADGGKRFLSLGLSQDAFAGLSIGYSQHPGILKDTDLQVYARISVPILLSVRDGSPDTWRGELGVNSGWLGTGKIGLIADARCYVMHHQQVLGTFVPLGMKLTLTPAAKSQNGYLGFQIKWDQNLVTHIAHSDYVKNTFTTIPVNDPQRTDVQPSDGWFGSTGSHLGFGIEGGRRFGQRFLVSMDMGILRFASPYTGMMDAMSMGQVPLYLDIRLHYKI